MVLVIYLNNCITVTVNNYQNVKNSMFVVITPEVDYTAQSTCIMGSYSNTQKIKTGARISEFT